MKKATEYSQNDSVGVILNTSALMNQGKQGCSASEVKDLGQDNLKLDVVQDTSDANELSAQVRNRLNDNKDNLRQCPSCGLMTIHGMPGGRDATCTVCGYKDPCCYD